MPRRPLLCALALACVPFIAPAGAQAAAVSLSQTGFAAAPGDAVTLRAAFAFDSAAHAFALSIETPDALRLISVSGNPFVTVSINFTGPGGVLPLTAGEDFSFSGLGAFPAGAPSYGLDLVFAADPGVSAVLSWSGYLQTEAPGGAPVFTAVDGGLGVALPAAPIPAPPALALLAGALVALAGRRRRRA